MKINNKRFWKFEAIMAVCATVMNALFLYQMNSGFTPKEFLTSAALVFPPFLLSGIVSWLVSKNDLFGTLFKWNFIFTSVFMVIANTMIYITDNTSGQSFSFFLFLSFFLIIISPIPLIICCYIYQKLS